MTESTRYTVHADIDNVILQKFLTTIKIKGKTKVNFNAELEKAITNYVKKYS
ncbi:MAG: hypothetical protein ACT4OW_02700 [Nitrososphaerota archaeon]